MSQRINKNAQIAQNFLENHEVGEVTHVNARQRANELAQATVGSIVKKSPHRLTYFEREQAIALGKKLTADGHLDLSDQANSASGPVFSAQSQNRNLEPASQSLSELMGTDLSEEQAKTEAEKIANEESRMPRGEAARCKIHCTKPGRTGCRFCQGRGYDVAQAERTARTEKVRKVLQKALERAAKEIQSLTK